MLDERIVSEIVASVVKNMNNKSYVDNLLKTYSLYDFKYDIKNTVMKLSNSHLYESIDSINNSSLAGSIAFHNSPNTGIITYYIDGYEELKPEEVTMDMFSEEKYTKKQLLDNQLVTADEPAFKLSKDENWSLILPIEEALSQDFLDEEYIKVRFLKNQYESWGEVSIIKGADNQTYLQLTFTNSMVTFAKDRFVDIELLLHDETGLKIPNTSIVNKEFYLIPRKYITKMDENADIGSILLETYKPKILELFETKTEFMFSDVTEANNIGAVIDQTDFVILTVAELLNSADVESATFTCTEFLTELFTGRNDAYFTEIQEFLTLGEQLCTLFLQFTDGIVFITLFKIASGE